MIPAALKSAVPLPLREAVWTIRRAWRDRRVRRKEADSVIGSAAARQLRRSAWLPQTVASVRLPGYEFPVHFRPRTSDPDVIEQVFVRQEYACVAGLAEVRTILDCGANIGCTAFYLLHAYPDAEVVVVEPDEANLRICRLNLAPFGERVRFLQAGVWPRAEPLRVERGKFRDGRAWSYQVRPCRSGQRPDMTGIPLRDLVSMLPSGVDLLKIDIEGAERGVFEALESDALERVRNIAIELHDEACERAFDRALETYSGERMVAGELTVIRNLQRRTARASQH
jgi:FkbM family methyltransferase